MVQAITTLFLVWFKMWRFKQTWVCSENIQRAGDGNAFLSFYKQTKGRVSMTWAIVLLSYGQALIMTQTQWSTMAWGKGNQIIQLKAQKLISLKAGFLDSLAAWLLSHPVIASLIILAKHRHCFSIVRKHKDSLSPIGLKLSLNCCLNI